MGLFDFLFKKKKNAKSPNTNSHQVTNLMGDALKQKKELEKLPAQWQLARAAKLGIEVTNGMTFNQLDKLLSNAEFNKPPTHQQLKKAKAFGVSVPAGMTYGELSVLLEKALLNQPATSEQIQLCEKIGIPIQSGLTREQADELISKAKENPKYLTRFQQLQNELNQQLDEEEDRELREKYGDKIVEEFRRWEQMYDTNQFLIVFKRGKSIVVEIAEFNNEPEIMYDKKPYISISLLTPTKERVDKGEYELNWEKELQIRSEHILHIQKLDTSLHPSWGPEGYESEDFSTYKKTIEKGRTIAKKFEIS